MIAVTGATGKLGRLVIASLLQRIPANEIVAAVRNPGKAAELAAQGVTIREADYTRPATLEAAFAGIDKLLLISSSEIGQRVQHHRNVIDAARRAGVKLFVYTSLLHADTSQINLAEEHRQTEAAILASGLPYVILRNGWYTENYEDTVRSAVQNGVLVGSAGDGRISSASRADYAEAAAVVLTSEGHEGKVYELAGDEAWTMDDLAREISRQVGRDIPYRNVDPGEYASLLIRSGIPEAYARMIADWDVAIAAGSLFDDGRQLSALIQRPTTPMARTVEAWLKQNR
ncbi:MAG: NADPH:quinone oxidoreductase 2 [Hydrogenibacillus schlegelii]|uniref:NADPH:quinone oxidoreductase 2 n=1 Tax=Hydrogenibacillus schlegelii TaxID=1484 RepID=A0A2T5GEK7_HYDSH|nr:SDR family oxidoreductase [Hydrogenibacillus schlegelii]PTQ54624.1 MAG: NADPH:quinone oxidoreductase 2 [Hydrogenibacillus schlegelii]